MNNSEATKLVQTIFPYITKIFSLNGSLYFEGKSGNDRILVSKKDNQWILTINEICFITAQGEKTPEEIAELQPENTIKYILRNPRRENPDYLTTEEWVDKYRKENYGSPPTKCEGDDSPQAEVPNTGTPQEIPEPKDLEGEEDFDFGDKGEDELAEIKRLAGVMHNAGDDNDVLDA